jgi:DNA-binding FadR family transcriptional regulator
MSKQIGYDSWNKSETSSVQDSPIVKSSISRQIAEQLRQAVVSGRFKIGERLPTEDELARRYGVSRPCVRETLIDTMNELTEY